MGYWTEVVDEWGPSAISREIDLEDELTRAAVALERVTARLDVQARTIECLEASLDAVLDDPDTFVCVIDGEGRVQAVSRGWIDRWATRSSPVGRRLDQLAPSEWSGVLDAVRDAGDAWSERPVDGGTLRFRRAGGSEDDGAGGVRFVLRFVTR